MKPTIFVLGPSDIEGQSWTEIEDSENGRVRGTAEWSGVLPIQPFIVSDRSLKEKSSFFLIGIQKGIRIPENTRVNLFNMVADPEASIGALKKVEGIKNTIKPARYFNRASAVLKTSRENLPKTLSNIPGCRVPRVKVADPKSFSQLENACNEFQTWPLIIRARGYHNGENMELLANSSQLKAIKDNPWLYDGIFLIEFLDCRNENNLYQKTRMIFIDGIPYPRHSIISDRWSIHSTSRSDLMDQDAELRLQEEHFLDYLRETRATKHRELFDTIQERIGLDIFGVDFAFVDNQFVIFEANACMDFLSIGHGKYNEYSYLQSYVTALKRAVKKMLMTA